MSLKGKNLADIQSMNRSLVLKVIQKKRQTSRAEISKLTGLNKATVTNIVNDLINWGVVKESGFLTGEGGHRSIAVELASDDFVIIGLWITRRSLHAGICNLDGNCDLVYHYPISTASPAEEVIRTICEKIDFLREANSNKKILGVAMAVPGPFIKNEDYIALITERNEWQKGGIIKKLREKIDLEMIIEHDADASCMAEWCYTENFDDKISMVTLSVGYGLGGCALEDGKILHGNFGGGGEIGHMSIAYDGIPCECGNIGCLEKYCTVICCLNKMKEHLLEYPDTCCFAEMNDVQLLEAYKKGDRLAKAVVNEAAEYLGYGIANVINIFLPSKIIIGDIMALAGEEFLKVVKKSARKRVLPVIFDKTEIVLSELSDSALKGACLSLVQKVISKPEYYFLNEQENKNEKG